MAIRVLLEQSQSLVSIYVGAASDITLPDIKDDTE